MSASLVGSEMCIRDSPTAPHGQPKQASAPRAGQAPSAAARASAEGASACLLYTSDAADDM
eukprot:5269746-Alexandrium_andersonii.AAC.1